MKKGEVGNLEEVTFQEELRKRGWFVHDEVVPNPWPRYHLPRRGIPALVQLFIVAILGIVVMVLLLW